MSKHVLLSALVGVRYGGEKLSLGQQFSATAEDADRFVSNGQAVVVTKEVTKALEAYAAGDGSKVAAAIPTK